MQKEARPILLFNDECGVCRRIARWVKSSGRDASGEDCITETPIGDDPLTLRSLNPDLDIWDAYETIHLLMPDGSMKLGGEAVAEVLRRLPNTRWFAWLFSVRILGLRPFQKGLDLAYGLLSEIRPIFGCESCGTPSLFSRLIQAMVKHAQSLFGRRPSREHLRHFTARPAAKPAPSPS